MIVYRHVRRHKGGKWEIYTQRYHKHLSVEPILRFIDDAFHHRDEYLSWTPTNNVPHFYAPATSDLPTDAWYTVRTYATSEKLSRLLDSAAYFPRNFLQAKYNEYFALDALSHLLDPDYAFQRYKTPDSHLRTALLYAFESPERGEFISQQAALALMHIHSYLRCHPQATPDEQSVLTDLWSDHIFKTVERYFDAVIVPPDNQRYKPRRDPKMLQAKLRWPAPIESALHDVLNTTYGFGSFDDSQGRDAVIYLHRPRQLPRPAYELFLHAVAESRASTMLDAITDIERIGPEEYRKKIQHAISAYRVNPDEYLQFDRIPYLREHLERRMRERNIDGIPQWMFQDS